VGEIPFLACGPSSSIRDFVSSGWPVAHQALRPVGSGRAAADGGRRRGAAAAASRRAIGLRLLLCSCCGQAPAGAAAVA
jgi:hypothetical protein